MRVICKRIRNTWYEGETRIAHANLDFAYATRTTLAYASWNRAVPYRHSSPEEFRLTGKIGSRSGLHVGTERGRIRRRGKKEEAGIAAIGERAEELRKGKRLTVAKLPVHTYTQVCRALL